MRSEAPSVPSPLSSAAKALVCAVLAVAAIYAYSFGAVLEASREIVTTPGEDVR